MTRKAVFQAPVDEADDTLAFLAGGAPRPAAPATRPQPTEPPAHAPVDTPDRVSPAETSSPDSAPARPARAPSRTPKTADAQRHASKEALQRVKRIGLYFEPRAWAALNAIALERGERGAASDYTSIVLEALQQQHPGRRWGS